MCHCQTEGVVQGRRVCGRRDDLKKVHQSKETVFRSNLVFFYNKNKILTTLFIVNYEKITL